MWSTYSPVKNNPADALAKVQAGGPSHSATTGELDIYQVNCRYTFFCQWSNIKLRFVYSGCSCQILRALVNIADKVTTRVGHRWLAHYDSCGQVSFWLWAKTLCFVYDFCDNVLPHLLPMCVAGRCRCWVFMWKGHSRLPSMACIWTCTPGSLGPPHLL